MLCRIPGDEYSVALVLICVRLSYLWNLTWHRGLDGKMQPEGYAARPRATHKGLQIAIKPDSYHVRSYFKHATLLDFFLH